MDDSEKEKLAGVWLALNAIELPICESFEAKQCLLIVNDMIEDAKDSIDAIIKI